MKKKRILIVIAVVLCLLAALLIGGLVWLKSNQSEPEPAPVANWDTDWYDAEGKEFTISTMEELYGLAELSATYDFKGQTIKLGADIVINEGDAAQWADKAPDLLWNPIVGFAGKFDGQDHTISGVYGNSIVTSLGLFTDTQKSCVIRNLKLVNSCFKNNNDMGTGSIIGIGGGKLENIYSDAVMVSAGKNVGGLIGCVNAKGENQIINCWFDGSIIMDGYDCSGVGGLVGAYTVEDAINTIYHCLSTADIDSMGENVGGVCGYVGNGAFLNLNDSMFTGTLVYDTNKYAVVGSMVGQVMGSASIIVNDAYTVDEIANRTIGTSAGYQKGNAIALNKDYLLGKAGYQWTTLDFENYWVAQKDGMPRLGYFTQASESIDGVEKMVDISWYDPAGATFEITNVQQLYGFAYLSRSYDFRGQTIKLGADITVNEGDASTWGKKAPAYNWTPIAWYGSSLSQRFKGIFDGQGHTVSGIYCKGTENITSLGFFGEVYHGAVVKDFKLVNSYFEGVQDSSIRGPVGSISGRLRGTIENVYSDAIVVNSSKNTGGIVGMITGTGQNKISGCWFDGELTGITRSGGILGGVYGNKGNITATIEHCLNTGEMNIQIGQAGVGGICGTAETWSILYVDDCLNAGTYKTFGTGKSESKHIGTLVGTVTKTDGVGSKAVVTDSYGVREFYERLVGWKHGDEGVDWNSMMYVEADELIGYDGYRWTSLDFKNHWAVRSNACPVPVAFATQNLSTSGVVRMVDYSWYDPDRTTNTVKTFQQLYGMARLWEVTNLFKGKTVLLGADITINKGNASDWGKKAPSYVWEPAKFNGTFNGQGHTISGIYVKGGPEDNYVGFFHRIYKDGTVKNLKIKNSYIEGTMDSSKRGAVGSLAGRSNGVIDTVYSDAIVVNSARMTGGLVGMITAEGKNVIRNSWFDGQISAINRTGGILGGMYGNKTGIKVTIENCTNTGDISVQIGQGDVGGICGMAETGGKLTISDCVNAGTYKTVGEDNEANTHVGSVFGSVTQKDGIASHVVLDNVYGVSDFYSKLVGWKYGDDGISSTAAVQLDMETLTAQDGYRYAQLDYTKEFALNKEGIPVPKAFGVKTVTAADLLDYSWFDSGKSEYTLTTAAQLEAFDVLCNGENNYFADKTVKLGADITLNEGDAAGWAAEAPEKIWTPITFNGTFDGQGHTVSGVYVKAEAQYNGFFNTLNSGAVVKNLKLTNSYIESVYTGVESRAGVGSIVGRNRGTVDTVYSNAIVVNSKAMTGGIAGMSEDGIITNCWFDGTIHGARATGGILGGAYAKTAIVEHCLNTGKVSVTDNAYYIGGICGELQNASTATVTDCLNAGTLEGTTVKSGAIVGRVDTKAALTVTNGYGTKEFLEAAIGDCTGTLNDSSYSVRAVEDLKGYGAYQWTKLDFETKPYWVLKKDAAPVLAAFDTSDLSLEEAKKLPDYSWYDESATEFVISNAQQLLSFNALCDEDTDYFNGKTVKLGADITLTGGSQTAPNWSPVRLKGTFDGQGHTVSGVYIKTTAKVYTGFFDRVDASATVKNLRLEDSYIEGNGANARSGVGSIAGRNYGTIDTVYSNATLKNSKKMTGGMVGMSFGGTVTNCWFDGTINAIGSTGGIIGGAYGQAATVAHCLNTGTITVSDGSEYVGGLYGYAEKASTLTISDSLYAGTIRKSAQSDAIQNVGMIIGGVDTDATLTVNDVYGAAAAASADTNVLTGDAIGALKGTVTNSSKYAVRAVEDLKGYGAYQWTSLDFETKPYWVLKKDATPVLAAFDTGDLSLEEAKKLPDYSWYDESATEFVISNAQQLLAFNELCNADTDYFKGKTVKLGADIALTGGSATKPNWTPINISGVFDGQGHTISGVYVKSGAQYNGFFNTVNSGATVKNLKLENSRIEGAYTGTETRAGVGSIAGRNYGTIDTVYSNAVVVNSKLMTGGIVGMSYSGTITNCWFDGQIIAAGSTGGILGGTYAAEATVAHCLNTGSITVETNGANLTAIGGLVGYAQSTGGVTVSDSLNAGTVTLNAKDGNTIKQVGSIIGAIHAKATVTTIQDVYGIKEFSASAIGYGTAAAGSADYKVVAKDTIKGFDAYHAMTLDFEVKPYWVLMDGDHPGLAAFGEGTLSVADAKSQPDTSWYDAASDTYTINTTAQLRGYAKLLDEGVDFSQKTIILGADTYELGSGEQLRAFAAVCEKNHFAGKTVVLTANINLGGADNPWTPVVFGGTFDGQGHTISGVHVVGENAGFFSAVTSGATVKNLMVAESSLKGTRNAGGIAGVSDGGKISNCQFAGAVSGANAGGIVGEAKNGATVEHCLNTGSVTGTANAGGLVGLVQAASISDSLNAGTHGGTATNTGALVGSNAGTLTLKNVYGIKEFAANAMGSGTATGAYAVKATEDLLGYGAYQWTALDFNGGSWVLKKEALPALNVFADTDLDLAYAKTLPDYTWYSETAETYVLTSARQLHGYVLLKDTVAAKTVTLGASAYAIATADQLLAFNTLSADVDYFAGKTVKLSNNIALTGGSTTKANWTPVSIKGTFDGQGHSISGVYVKASSQYTGLFHTVYADATVRNLKLVDSYIEGNGSETRSGVGSIAGRNYGTIDTVYSNATVKNSKQMTGGIVGMSFGGTTGNCWFDGTIHGKKATGGILGGTYNDTALITHCLFTGTIIDEFNGAKVLIGGLCGYAQNSGTNTASVTIRDSLSAGTLQSSSTSQIGAIVGGATKAMTIGNVYAATDTGFGSKNYGWTGVAAVVDAGSEVVIGALETFFGTGAEKLDFATWWTARDGKIPMLKSFS